MQRTARFRKCALLLDLKALFAGFFGDSAVFRGAVPQIGNEPAFRLGYVASHPHRVVLDLISSEGPDVEVAALRVGEIEPAHARGGRHGTALREFHAGLLGLQEIKQGAFGSVVRAGRIAEGRPDPFGQDAKPEMPRLKGPRNAALVKDELVKALTKAEELKAELDALMNAQSDETGPSLAIGIR